MRNKIFSLGDILIDKIAPTGLLLIMAFNKRGFRGRFIDGYMDGKVVNVKMPDLYKKVGNIFTMTTGKEN